MVFEEKTVSTREIYNGRVFRVREDVVQMPGGRVALRDIVEHPGGVAVVPITGAGEVVMVRQFRKPLDCALLEIPAGKLEKGEPHYDCGIRELKEETGCSAERFEYLGYINPSPGFADEKIHLYLAANLTMGDDSPDLDEYLEVEYIPLERAVEMAANGEITDGKTVAGLFRANALIQKEREA